MNFELKNRKLVIIGASGHGKVVADIAVKNKYSNIVFLDDNDEIKECAGYPVVGKTNSFNQYNDCVFTIAIGESKSRQHFFKVLTDSNLEIVSLIHPSAVISRRVKIGIGTVVMAGAVINSDSRIGECVVINTGASVDHDGVVEDFSHISVGAHVAGTVMIGKRTWIGAGAIILNNISICDDCMIGAGAVVLHSIDKQGTYIGIPAKMIRGK